MNQIVIDEAVHLEQNIHPTDALIDLLNFVISEQGEGYEPYGRTKRRAVI